MDFSGLYKELVALVPKATAAFKSAEPIIAEAVGLVSPALISDAEKAVAIGEKVIEAIPEVQASIAIAEKLVSGLKAVARGETPDEWTAFVAEKKLDDAAVLALQPTGN